MGKKAMAWGQEKNWKHAGRWRKMMNELYLRLTERGYNSTDFKNVDDMIAVLSSPIVEYNTGNSEVFLLRREARRARVREWRRKRIEKERIKAEKKAAEEANKSAGE